MKVLMKGYSDLVHSYEHYLKDQEEDDLLREEEEHLRHLEACASDIGIAERRGLEKGKSEGLVLAVLIMLQARFQEVPEPIRQQLFKLSEPKTLERLAAKAATCADMDEFIGILNSVK